jgi:ferredoxin--NADP+ reductase
VSDRPLRVVVVGAGPAGFYAAAALLDADAFEVRVDLVERLLAPYGLVRYGVAPDHPKIKNVIRVYERVALDDRVRFLGNVTLGTDVTVEDLHRHYDALVYAVGAQTDRTLGIPGEELGGCLASTVFVAWYNGHPYYADFSLDLAHRSVAVVGIGNVALDVARILAQSASSLATTDIANPALARLRRSDVTDIHVLARRGPVHAKCTPGELQELGRLEGVSVVVDERDLVLDDADTALLDSDRNAAKNLEILRGFAASPGRGDRRVHLHFFASPTEVLGDGGMVTGLRIQRNELRVSDDGSWDLVGSGEDQVLDVTMVIRAIGYRSEPIPGVPFDHTRFLIRNHEGRVIDDSGQVVPREYVVGWAKRGPRGLIGTNKADAAGTIALAREDLHRLGPARDVDPDPDAMARLLEERGVRVIRFAQWQLLDRLEVARGEGEGRPRVKFIRHHEMLDALDGAGDDEAGKPEPRNGDPGDDE